MSCLKSAKEGKTTAKTTINNSKKQTYSIKSRQKRAAVIWRLASFFISYYLYYIFKVTALCKQSAIFLYYSFFEVNFLWLFQDKSFACLQNPKNRAGLQKLPFYTLCSKYSKIPALLARGEDFLYYNFFNVVRIASVRSTVTE